MRAHRPAPLQGTWVVPALLVLLFYTPVHASLVGLMYRAAGTGRWAAVAMKEQPLPPGSMYAGWIFDNFGKKPTLASTTDCGGASLVAFCARVSNVSTYSHVYAVFLYDAASGTVHDVEPLHWPASCSRVSPAIVIDPNACQAHVIYNGIDNSSGQSQRAIRDAAFSLPGLTSGAITTLVQDYVTPAPPPFPDGAVMHLPSTLPLSAAYGPGPGVVVAFYALVKGFGLVSGSGKGIFSWATGGTLMTHARSGDPSCPPPWPDAGAVYTSFSPGPSAAATLGRAVAFVARSNGARSKNSAIVLNESGCGGTNVVQAAEHSPTPLGGRYDDLRRGNKELAGAANGTTVFMANVLGIGGTSRALIRSTGDVVARDGFADTALGAAMVGLAQSEARAINSAGAVVFAPKLSGFSGRPVLYDTPAILPELVTINRSAYPQIDDLGNMVVCF
jgi:hypothetical protein